MRDLKFLQTGLIKEPPEDTSSFLPVTAQVYSKFVKNHQLALGVKAIPGYAALSGFTWAVATTEAKSIVLGLRLAAKDKDEQQRVVDKAWERMNQLMRVARMRGLSESLGEMTDVFEKVVDNSIEYVSELVDMMLKSMIVQTWTAMEVLIEDLHEEARLAYPKVFSSGKSRSYGSRWNFRAAYFAGIKRGSKVQRIADQK